MIPRVKFPMPVSRIRMFIDRVFHIREEYEDMIYSTKDVYVKHIFQKKLKKADDLIGTLTAKAATYTRIYSN